MKKKILSFVLAICLILPFGIMLSGCTSKEDPNTSNITLETVQNDFGQVIHGIQRTFSNAKSFFSELGGTYIEYSLVDNWATLYTMSTYDSKVWVHNKSTNEVLSSRNLNETASQYEITEEAIDKVIDSFYSSKFAYYNGYLINLSTGEWESIVYDDYEDDTILFMDNYLDIYTGRSTNAHYSFTTKVLRFGPSGNGQDIYSIKI